MMIVVIMITVIIEFSDSSPSSSHNSVNSTALSHPPTHQTFDTSTSGFDNSNPPTSIQQLNPDEVQFNRDFDEAISLQQIEVILNCKDTRRKDDLYRLYCVKIMKSYKKTGKIDYIETDLLRSKVRFLFLGICTN